MKQMKKKAKEMKPEMSNKMEAHAEDTKKMVSMMKSMAKEEKDDDEEEED